MGQFWTEITPLGGSILGGNQQHGKRVLASYARRGVKNHGMLAEIAYAVNRKEIADGGRELLEAGLSDFTFARVVLDYPDRFEPEVVAAAKARLA